MTAQEFAALHDRHYGMLYFWILDRAKNRELAEDVCAEAFIRAWNHRDQLREPDHFKTWLFAIAKYRLLEVKRHLDRYETLDDPDQDWTERLPEPRDFAQEFEKRESWRRVRAAFRLLSETERSAVECLTAGMSQKEAAKAQGIGIMTAGSRLCNARKTLAGLCGKEIL